MSGGNTQSDQQPQQQSGQAAPPKRLGVIIRRSPNGEWALVKLDKPWKGTGWFRVSSLNIKGQPKSEGENPSSD